MRLLWVSLLIRGNADTNSNKRLVYASFKEWCLAYFGRILLYKPCLTPLVSFSTIKPASSQNLIPKNQAKWPTPAPSVAAKPTSPGTAPSATARDNDASTHKNIPALHPALSFPAYGLPVSKVRKQKWSLDLSLSHLYKTMRTTRSHHPYYADPFLTNIMSVGPPSTPWSRHGLFEIECPPPPLLFLCRAPAVSQRNLARLRRALSVLCNGSDPRILYSTALLLIIYLCVFGIFFSNSYHGNYFQCG